MLRVLLKLARQQRVKMQVSKLRQEELESTKMSTGQQIVSLENGPFYQILSHRISLMLDLSSLISLEIFNKRFLPTHSILKLKNFI